MFGFLIHTAVFLQMKYCYNKKTKLLFKFLINASRNFLESTKQQQQQKQQEI